MSPISGESKTRMSRSLVQLSELNQQASDNYGFSLSFLNETGRTAIENPIFKKDDDRNRVHLFKKTYKSDLDDTLDLSMADTGNAKSR